MKKVTLKLTALVMLLGGVITAQAQTNTNLNTVTTAVAFLRINPDTRSSGMGDAGIATSPDAYSIWHNQAKTPFNTGKAGLSVNYTPWLRDLSINDVYFATIAGYYKMDEQSAISASVRYFSLGDVQFTDQLGNDLNTFRPREFAINAGYSRKLSSKNSLGVAVTYINSKLASGNVNNTNYKTGSSVAGDLHFFHNGTKENGSGVNWGATLSNLGAKVSYTSDASQKDFIPANLGLGVAYTKVFDESNKITFALDLNKLLVPTPPTDTASATLAAYRNKGVVSSWFSSFSSGSGGGNEAIREVNVSVGAEYWYNNQFAFRAGYFYENPTKGARKFFSIGAGLKYNMFGLNFSYLFPSGSGANRSALSNTYRFGLVFDFKK
jgi:hypothetical protein